MKNKHDELSQAENISVPEKDESLQRRDLVKALFGAAGVVGAVSILGCEEGSEKHFSGDSSGLLPGDPDLNATVLRFATMSDMKASGPANDGTVGVLAGFYSPGDGGGGVFFFDQDIGSTDSNGGTIVVDNNNSGCWVRVYEGPINVRWFGACGYTIGNPQPQTDDVYIQSAIDSLLASDLNRKLFIPSGVYVVNTTIDIDLEVTISGEGSSSKLTAGASNIKIFSISGQSAADLLDSVVIEDLSFDGQSNSNIDGVFVQYSNNVAVRSCEFYNFGNTSDTPCKAINYYNENYNSKILNNYIHDCVGNVYGSDIVVYAWGGDAEVSGNRCYSSNSQGIYVSHSNKTKRVIVTNNIVKNHARHGIMVDYPPSISPQASTIISNNICYDCESTGIYVYSGDTGGYLISDNMVECCGGGGANDGGLSGAIVAIGDGKKSILGNYIYNTGLNPDGSEKTKGPLFGSHEAVAIRVSNSNNGTLVSNNTIDYSTGMGILLYNYVDKVKVTNNYILNASTSGINITAVDTVTSLEIVSNSINTVNYTPHSLTFSSQSIGINFLYLPAASKENISVKNNSVVGNESSNSYGLQIVNPFSGTIDGNIFSNWDHAVHLANSYVSDTIGTELLFNNNILQNSSAGLRHALSSGVFAFGSSNEFFGNTNDEIISGFDGYRNAIAIRPLKTITDSAPPSSGTWNQGDTILNINPSPGSYIGWVCTTGGTPGTWKSYGSISL